MKTRIALLLFFLSSIVFAQNPTPFSKVKITKNKEDNTATKINVQSANGEINYIDKSSITQQPSDWDATSGVTRILNKPAVIKGDKGDAGVQGAKGDRGDKGENGYSGSNGNQGEKGDKGDKGDIGLTGAKGDKGDSATSAVESVKGELVNNTDPKNPVVNTPTLQHILDKNPYGTLNNGDMTVSLFGKMNDNDDEGFRSVFFQKISTSSFTSFYLRDYINLFSRNFKTNNSTYLTLFDGKFELQKSLGNGRETAVRFNDPTCNAVLNFPAPTIEGDYTLATTKDIKVKTVNNISPDSNGNIVVSNLGSGVKGDKGDTGLTGAKGDTGLTGETGQMGVTGIQGIQGEKGDTGDAGIQGEKGDSAASGVETVTGEFVNNKDAKNPIVNAPNLRQVMDVDNNTDKPIIINGSSFFSENNSIDIGSGHKDNVGRGHICIGDNSGRYNNGYGLISLGSNAGYGNNGNDVICIGLDAGKNNIRGNAICIGSQAGENNLGNNAICIAGGYGNTGDSLIAIGGGAYENRGENVISIGAFSGNHNTFNNVTIFGKYANATADNQLVFSSPDASKNIKFNCDIPNDLLLQFPVNSGRLVTEDDFESGSYTPVISDILGLSNITVNSSTYSRIRNIVTARISMTAVVGNSTTYKFSYSLPINRAGAASMNIGSGLLDNPSGIYAFIANSSTQVTGNASFYASVFGEASIVINIQYNITE
jgi:hypothetical protein